MSAKELLLEPGSRLLSLSVHRRAAQRLKLSDNVGSSARAQAVLRPGHVGMYQHRPVGTYLLATAPDQCTDLPIC
jgi:hypothetical protein